MILHLVVRTAEVGIAPVHGTGIFRVVYEKFQDSLFVVLEAFALNAFQGLGVIPV